MPVHNAMSASEVAHILEQLHAGKTNEQIARNTRRSTQTVARIRQILQGDLQPNRHTQRLYDLVTTLNRTPSTSTTVLPDVPKTKPAIGISATLDDIERRLARISQIHEAFEESYVSIDDAMKDLAAKLKQISDSL